MSLTVIRSRAPLRVSFAGGGTDVHPFPALEGGAVLSATINRYAYGTLTPRADDLVCIESVDFGLTVRFDPNDPVTLDGEFDLFKAAIKRLNDGIAPGFDMLVRSSAAPGSGLGSSSTVIVCLVGLLCEHYGLSLTEYEIADLAHQIERDDLGIAGGLQDQYAAAFGGFNFIEFDSGNVLVNPLRVSENTVRELECSVLLVDLGMTRQSSQIIDDQTARLERRDLETLMGLRMQKALAFDMKTALLRGRVNEFGDLLDMAWVHKQRMSPKISNDRINEAYEVARRNGALGGKITGAGGGGHMLMFCDLRNRHTVADALTAFGATVHDIAFEPRGLTTWTCR
jgi:D-glycero-alpha-D-manno-heptose-7-phosphate kinase